MNRLKRFMFGVFAVTLGTVIVCASYALASDEGVTGGIAPLTVRAKNAVANGH